MKSPAVEQHCDVIYHRYPSTDFDDAQKPIPTALAVEPEATEDEEASCRQVPQTPPSHIEPLDTSRRCFCGRLGRLLVFHLLNAVLGLGGAIFVIVMVPLSVGLVVLFGVGIVLFQVTAAAVELLAKADIGLANLITTDQKLHKAFGVQSGFSTNNGCSTCTARLLFLSPRMLLVMVYFATAKLATGMLSLIAMAWGLVLPIAALCGDADVIGYEHHSGTYVVVVLIGWVIGMLCIVLVPKPSIALTKWACAGHGVESEIYSAKAPTDTPITDLEASQATM